MDVGTKLKGHYPKKTVLCGVRAVVCAGKGPRPYGPSGLTRDRPLTEPVGRPEGRSAGLSGWVDDSFAR